MVFMGYQDYYDELLLFLNSFLNLYICWNKVGKVKMGKRTLTHSKPQTTSLHNRIKKYKRKKKTVCQVGFRSCNMKDQSEGSPSDSASIVSFIL